MSTRNTMLPFDPEIERTILAARRVVSLSHRINTELDTQLNSDSGHSDCVHSIDLSDCDSDSISDSLVSTNSDIMAGEQANHHTLKELGAPDVNYQPLCIQYPDLAANFELKSGLIHLLPKFHGLAALVRKDDPEVVELLPRSVEIVIGDVGDPDTLKAAVEGCNKIIYCATARSPITADLFRVDYRGVYNLTKAFQSDYNNKLAQLWADEIATKYDGGMDSRFEFTETGEAVLSVAPLVVIIMGSDSDLPVMKIAAEILKTFGVPYEINRSEVCNVILECDR
ncbi:hypothetical protein K1719_014609 [Acacia pycnantha]|nr:hypothetical protein K1719_014609 [Acacia pycnantha]